MSFFYLHIYSAFLAESRNWFPFLLFTQIDIVTKNNVQKLLLKFGKSFIRHACTYLKVSNCKCQNVTMPLKSCLIIWLIKRFVYKNHIEKNKSLKQKASIVSYISAVEQSYILHQSLNTKTWTTYPFWFFFFTVRKVWKSISFTLQAPQSLHH